jgi:hypothetical protein
VHEPTGEDEGGARGERDVRQRQRCRSRWQPYVCRSTVFTPKTGRVSVFRLQKQSLNGDSVFGVKKTKFLDFFRLQFGRGSGRNPRPQLAEEVVDSATRRLAEEVVMSACSMAADRWFRTKSMRTQLLLSFGLLVVLVMAAFIGIWAGSVFWLKDALISDSKTYLLEQISLIAFRVTSEVSPAISRQSVAALRAYTTSLTDANVGQ